MYVSYLNERFMDRLIMRRLALATSLLAAGCFSITTNNLSCGSDRSCPPGQTCGDDGKCHSSSGNGNGNGGDGGGDLSASNDMPMSIGDMTPDLTPARDLTAVPDLTDPCMNHVKDGHETDVDCGGGTCAACGTGKVCVIGGDCSSLLCNMTTHLCAADHCGDGVRNAGESDVDCGGTCSNKCASGQGCTIAGDCVSGFCNSSSGLCAAGQCVNGTKDGDETDVDCGGSCSTKCTVGKACLVNGDCAGMLCNGSHVCVSAGCSNSVKDGAETDVDCGGGTCATCANSKSCSANGDCTSTHCAASICRACVSSNDCPSHGACTLYVCQAASCNDSINNGAETDVDCGGGTCGKCGNGGGCSNGPRDCTSKVCTNGTCQVPTCADSVINGAETDLDCGGGTCGKCGNGQGCSNGARDCVSGVCSGGLCAAATCNDGVKNGAETDIDCGGGTCGTCGTGKGCSNASRDCASGVCTAGSCAAPTCSDGVKNQDETDTDCGGTCAGSPSGKCANGKVCSVGSDCVSSDCAAHVCTDHCSNSSKDFDETDVDCGGSYCTSKCILAQGCGGSSDCSTGACSAGYCVQSSGPPYWVAAASMGTGRAFFGAQYQSTGGSIWVYGGMDTSATCISSAAYYTQSTNSWTDSTYSISQSLAKFATVIDSSDRIWVLGGGISGSGACESATSSSVYHGLGEVAWYNPGLPISDSRIYGAAVAAADGKFYLSGGRDYNGATQYSVYQLSPPPGCNNSGCFSTAAPSLYNNNTRYRHAAALAADGSILVIGGYDNSVYKSVEAYKPGIDGSWSLMASTASPHIDASAVTAPDGRTYVIGNSSSVSTTGVVEAYQGRAANRWVTVQSLSIGRSGSAASLSPDGRIYALGGIASGSLSPTTTVEYYGPKVTRTPGATTGGAAGTAIAISGSNFGANATVRFYLDDTSHLFSTTTATTDESGGLSSTNLSSPSGSVGAHTMIIRDDRSLYPISLPWTIN